MNVLDKSLVVFGPIKGQTQFKIVLETSHHGAL